MSTPKLKQQCTNANAIQTLQNLPQNLPGLAGPPLGTAMDAGGGTAAPRS